MNKSIRTIKKERRSGCDRRQFSYAIYLPERRLAEDRRSSIKIPGSSGIGRDLSSIEFRRSLHIMGNISPKKININYLRNNQSSLS